MPRVRGLVLLAAVLGPSLASGCNPLAMGIYTPLPIQPWVAERVEERLKHGNSDHRTPIMPPIPPGHRPLCEDPPDRATILRAMPRVTRGVPYFYEEFRDDIEITVEKIADHMDPPKFYPLIGPAQLHHCHWKCTVYYTETIESSYPFPFQTKKRRVEVLSIDRDHLHLFVEGDENQQSITRDLTAGRAP